MFTELDRRMKALETFHDAVVSEGKMFAIRLDGRSFSRLTEKHFRKPFDPIFFEMVDAVSSAVLGEFDGLYAFTQSDEVSVLFGRKYSTFGRRVEKLVSVVPAFASAVFSKAFIEAATFDGRIVSFDSDDDVRSYFAWRASDGYRNAVNTACYWKLRQDGMTSSQATRKLQAFDSQSDKREFLGPAWEQEPNRSKHGRAFVWGTFEKDGLNPLTGEVVPAVRRKIIPAEGGMLSRHNVALQKVIEEDRT